MPLERNENDELSTPTLMFSMSVGQSRSSARMELDFDLNSPCNHFEPQNSSNSDQFRDLSNLRISRNKRRSFTPIKNDFCLRSPELSPITPATVNRNQTTPNPHQSSINCNSLDSLSPSPGQFKVPQPLKLNDITTPIRPSTTTCQTEDSPFEDPNQTTSLDKSASHGFLNHKLEVRLILKKAGMQKYSAVFDREKVDFGKFLSLNGADLLRFGIKRTVDRKVILSIINDLNGN